MSGHSKWSSIKHKKAATDAKRAQLFTKVARDISVAARAGGDPAMNSALRLALQRARDSNMPNSNVERAIQRGAGGGESDALEEVTYEAYGPGGTALLIQTVTDNRNRTVADVRSTVTASGGSLAEAGAVAWQFELHGLIVVDASDADVDEVQLTAIEAGAIDVSAQDGEVEVLTAPGDIEAVRAALTDAGLPVERAEVAQVPANLVELDEHAAAQMLRLLERLDDLDDVSRVYANADFPAEVIAAAEASG